MINVKIVKREEKDGFKKLYIRLIRNIHAILLDSVRGQNKQPGEFRKSQNWIGGSSLTNAYFIPPHHSQIEELMGDFENFLHKRWSVRPYIGNKT
ncbi:MAG TPA: hypothetical protein ENK66_07945 [Arcobacter sp.]|nr:hypothetical protein [Arcobacter sp.]